MKSVELRFLTRVAVSGVEYVAGDVANIPEHKAVGLLRRGHAEVVGKEAAAKEPAKERATAKKAKKRG